MSIERIVQQAGIPLLVFMVCIYYGMRLLLLHDMEAIRNKNKPPVKNKTGYTRMGGILILFLAGITLLMAILLFINIHAALGEIIIGSITFGVLWKKMDLKYGS